MLDGPNGENMWKIILGTITTLVLGAYAAIRAVVNRRNGTSKDQDELLHKMREDIVRVETQMQMLLGLDKKLDEVVADVEYLKGKIKSS